MTVLVAYAAIAVCVARCVAYPIWISRMGGREIDPPPNGAA